jgi:hypothetical protein
VLARRIDPELRYLPIGNSLILNRELEEGIEVVRVVQGARRLDGLLGHGEARKRPPVGVYYRGLSLISRVPDITQPPDTSMRIDLPLVRTCWSRRPKSMASAFL